MFTSSTGTGGRRPEPWSLKAKVVFGASLAAIASLVVVLITQISHQRNPADVAATTRAAGGATAAPTAAAAFPPLSAGIYTVNLRFYTGGGLTVTLTTITVGSDGRTTADVVYRNVVSQTLSLGCAGITDPAEDTLTRSDGTVYPAAHSYCSDNPTASFSLDPGATFTSYATFSGVTGARSSFAFTWQRVGGISGTVSGLTL